MTFTTSNDNYAFFVVGGDSSGTDTGRVYLAMRQLTGSSYTYALFDSGQNSTHYLTWTHSSWTNATMIVLGNPWLAVSDSITYFNATFDAMVAAGIGGSVLYDSVVTI